MKFKYCLLFISVVFFACSRPAPQIPANKPDANDSLGLAVAQANEKLIIAEDSLVKEYVIKTDSGFRHHKSGFWYKINYPTNLQPLRANGRYRIQYSVYTFDNKFLLNETRWIETGKRQIIRGLDEALMLMRRGEKATLIIPWYLAYGLKGDLKTVTPYTSVVVYLYVYGEISDK